MTERNHRSTDELTARLREVFAQELETHVVTMNEDLLALERQPGDPERQKSLFRTAHTIKGAARAAGVSLVEQVCHRMEERLASARSGGEALEPHEVEHLLRVADVLEAAGATLKAGRDPDPRPLLALLGDGPDQPAPSEPAPSAAASPEAADLRKPEEPAPAAGAAAGAPASTSGVGPRIHVQVSKLDDLQATAGLLRVDQGRWRRHVADVARVRRELQGLVQPPQARRPASGRRRETPIPVGQEARNPTTGRLRSLQKEVTHLLRSARETLRSSERSVEAVAHSSRVLYMRPFQEACHSLPRVVRDVAAQSGKSARIEIEGGAVEVDRNVLQALQDALVQLVRNAVDHGIEAPRDRAAAGKDAAGLVRVAASIQGDQLSVEVRDDGAGLDEEALRAAVLGRGGEAPRTRKEIAAAVLAGGLSTRAEATAISGRGVGLDVAGRAVEAVQGTLDVQWEKGRGTTFTLTCPVSLTTMRCVVARTDSHTLAIPTVQVDRLARPRRDEVRRSGGRAVLPGEEEPMPLVPLGDVIGLSSEWREPGTHLKAVIVESEGRRVGLVVDELLREEELVIRPVSKAGIPTPFVAGLALLPTGDAAPVLNVATVVRRALERAPWTPPERKDPDAEASRHHLVVVDDSITTRTLERSILQSAGYRVSAAADGAEAWELLQKEPADLVVADVQMPRLDGFELCRLIRSSPRLRDLPVILVTAREAEEDQRRGLEVGADAYLGKSGFDQEELLSAIRQLLP